MIGARDDYRTRGGPAAPTPRPVADEAAVTVAGPGAAARARSDHIRTAPGPPGRSSGSQSSLGGAGPRRPGD
eukprot:223922-Hanusia_phi.AAC.1